MGKYEYKVLPMGLTNAPAVFRAAMNKIFGPALNIYVCVYKRLHVSLDWSGDMPFLMIATDRAI